MPMFSPETVRAAGRTFFDALGNMATKAPKTTAVGKALAERAAYGTLGYGVGSGAEHEMKSQGADISPGSAAAMKINPAIMYALLGPTAAKWGAQPFKNPEAFGTISRVWRPATIGAAATINPVISYLTDPGKKRIKGGLEDMREISGTVPNYLKSVSDDISAFQNASKYKEDPQTAVRLQAGDAAKFKRTGKVSPAAKSRMNHEPGNISALGETLKRIISPTVNLAIQESKDTLVPAVTAGIDPAIRSAGKQVAGGALGALGGYGLANWLLPQVKQDDIKKRMTMTPEDLDVAYHKRQRKETNRKALAALIGALGGTAGSILADPETAKYWWQMLRGKGGTPALPK